jgi:branched-subunit amino acid ABC-type transport system permease component
MSNLKLLVAWLAILPFMIANGIFRELVVKQAVADRAAEAISVALGIVIMLLLTRFLLRPLSGKATSQLVRASIVLVALTVTFEFLFGHYVDGRSWSELLENYEIWNGRLWPVALAALAFMPFLWGRWSIERTRHAGQ